MMAGARELMARGQGGPAALVLVEVEDPGASRGWTQLALDVLVRGIPRTTLMHTHAVQSAAWSPDGLRVVTASGRRVGVGVVGRRLGRADRPRGS
jgi:hypothetical protein